MSSVYIFRLTKIIVRNNSDSHFIPVKWYSLYHIIFTFLSLLPNHYCRSKQSELSLKVFYLLTGNEVLSWRIKVFSQSENQTVP